MLDKVRKNVEMLNELEWLTGKSIVSRNVEQNLNERAEALEAISGLSNAENATYDWEEFKTSFISKQEQMGFIWRITRGQGGPITLERVELSVKVGEALASKEFSGESSGGDFGELIDRQLSNLYSQASENDLILEFGEAREAFKEFTRNGMSFKFTRGRGSTTYICQKNEFKYTDGRGGNVEKRLGERISGQLKQYLELDLLDHSQVARAGKKYQNADFEGLRIQRHIEGDRFLMYSFELKRGNSIQSVSEAISQAVNYTEKSHFTYIIIPAFGQFSFHDPDRWRDFLEICRRNNIGAISVEFEAEGPGRFELNEVLTPVETRLVNSDRLFELVAKSKYELCPLCRRIVKEGTRADCGWKVKNQSGEEFCMKELIQDNLIQGNLGAED